MPIAFSTRHQTALLSDACEFTRSMGFANDAVAVGGFIDGKLEAVLVLEHATKSTAYAHFGGTQRAFRQRDMVAGFCKYAFLVRKHEQLIFPIAAWNTPALIAALKIGGFVSGVLRGGAIDGGDATMVTLAKTAARWPTRPKAAEPKLQEAEE